MWWWAPTNAHHCAIQLTITLTTFLYCILQCTNNATSCSKAINHKIKFSIITQKFPGGPFKFQEISRISRRVFKFQEISRSCRHPDKDTLKIAYQHSVVAFTSSTVAFNRTHSVNGCRPTRFNLTFRLGKGFRFCRGKLAQMLRDQLLGQVTGFPGV